MIVGAAIVLGSARIQSRNSFLGVGGVVAAIATALTAAELAAMYGVPRASQVGWLVTAVAMEIALLILMVRRFASCGERAVVIAILIVVGLHFLPMTPAFGPAVALLGVLCTANALLGVHNSGYSLRALWAVDGGLKVAAGAAMWTSHLISYSTDAP